MWYAIGMHTNKIYAQAKHKSEVNQKLIKLYQNNNSTKILYPEPLMFHELDPRLLQKNSNYKLVKIAGIYPVHNTMITLNNIPMIASVDNQGKSHYEPTKHAQKIIDTLQMFSMPMIKEIARDFQNDMYIIDFDIMNQIA